MLQRLHLALTAHGLAMQHLNQAIEVAERERVTGRPPTIGARLVDIAGAEDVVAMVRVGHPSGRAIRSPRRPYRDVLI